MSTFVTTSRWQKLSLAGQLANVGSEVARAIRWQNVGDREQKEKSAERALELLDLSIDAASRASQRWELLRLREVLCDALYDHNAYDTNPDHIENYFLPFALVAQKR